MSKVSVVGTGFVGASSAFSMALRGTASDLVLVDLNKQRARAEALDISHAAAATSGTRVHSGDYSDIVGSAVVVVAAGVNQKPGESRLDLVARNVDIFKSVIPQVVKFAPKAVILIAANPVDIMTETTRLLHPDPSLVLGTGTLLDTARFRDLISRETAVNSRHVHADVLGEHGDSSVLAWSTARVAGLPISDFFDSIGKSFTKEMADTIETKVRGAAGEIIIGKQATYYGIGAAVMRIVEAILNDSNTVMTVSGPTEHGVCLTLPSIVGKTGISHVIQPMLSEEEEKKMQYSVGVLLETQSSVIKNGTFI